MRTRLGMQNRLNTMWNIAPRNKTQTRYNRFRQTPRGKMKSGFTDAAEAFQQTMKPYKTLYERYFGEL